MSTYDIVDRAIKYSFYVVMGAAAILVVREQHLRTVQNALTPEQKLDIAEGKLDRLLGAVNANLKTNNEQVEMLRGEVVKVTKDVAEFKGNKEALKIFADKFSPEAYADEVRKLKESVDFRIIREHQDNAVKQMYDAMRVFKDEVYVNVRRADSQQVSNLDNLIDKFNKVITILNTLQNTLKEDSIIEGDDVTITPQFVKPDFEFNNF